jgi:C4-dicarboxylate-specific signal transduction histidine kinase
MSTYRDELGAAMARATRAEAQLEAVESSARERLQAVERELSSLRDAADARRSERTRPVLITALAMMALALLLLGRVILRGQQRLREAEEAAQVESNLARAREASMMARVAEERAIGRKELDAEFEARLRRSAFGPSIDEVVVSPDFNRPAVGAAIARARATLTECRAGAAGVGGTVLVVYEPSGVAVRATVESPTLAAGTTACVAERFQAQRVPAFRGVPVAVRAGFRID